MAVILVRGPDDQDPVIPAQAGILQRWRYYEVPAFAGTTPSRS